MDAAVDSRKAVLDGWFVVVVVLVVVVVVLVVVVVVAMSTRMR
jgi:hypothetical protein